MGSMSAELRSPLEVSSRRSILSHAQRGSSLWNSGMESPRIQRLAVSWVMGSRLGERKLKSLATTEADGTRP